MCCSGLSHSSWPLRQMKQRFVNRHVGSLQSCQNKPTPFPPGHPQPRSELGSSSGHRRSPIGSAQAWGSRGSCPPGVHKGVPQSAHVPPAFRNSRWLCLAPCRQFVFLSSPISPEQLRAVAHGGAHQPGSPWTPLAPPLLWGSSAAQAAAFSKDSYFFFSSSIKGRSDSIRVERRERGTMPTQQAGRGGTAAVRCPRGHSEVPGSGRSSWGLGERGAWRCGRGLLVHPHPQPQEQSWAAGGFTAWQGIPKWLVGLQQGVGYSTPGPLGLPAARGEETLRAAKPRDQENREGGQAKDPCCVTSGGAVAGASMSQATAGTASPKCLCCCWAGGQTVAPRFTCQTAASAEQILG